jgi:hypothetical protein
VVRTALAAMSSRHNVNVTKEKPVALWFALIGGLIVVLMLVRLLIGCHLRDVDDYHERDYREPPIFTMPDSHGGGAGGI